MAGKFIDVTLRLVDKMTAPLTNAGKALANHASQFQKAGREIQKAGKAISSVGSSMTKGITMPIAAAGTACIKLAADFEQGMSKVASISGVSEKSLEKLSDKAKEMGAKTKYSATEATEAYEYMAMAGWKTKDMLDGIEPIMKLAGASGEELATTSDILTDGLTAFGKSAKDAGHFADVMAAASSNANTNVSMMGESFKYCAPVAGALGYNVEDISKALGLMANNGVKASGAGTALRSWMSRMAAPTDEVQTAMKKLGLSLTDSKGNMKSFDTVMQETRKAFAGLTEAEKSQYASVIAGKAGMSGMLAVVNGSDKDFNKLTKAINESDGACNKMYETANDNLNGQLTILKSTLESIAISFGEKLTPYIKIATNWIQKMADKFNSLSDEQQKTIIKIALVAASIGPAILVFGKVVGTVGKVVSAIGKIGRAFKTFGSLAGIITSPAGIVIAIVAGLAAVAVLVWKNWDKIQPKIKSVITAITKVFRKIEPTIKAMQKTVQKSMPAIQTAINKAFKAIQPYIKMAGELLKKIANVIKNVIAKAIQSAKPLIEKFGDAFNAVFPVIADIVTNKIEIVTAKIEALRPVFEIAFSIIGSVIEGFGDTVSEIFDGICKVVGGILDFITGVFTGNWEKAWKGVKDIFSGIFKTFVAIAKAPINGVIDIINGAIRGLNKVKVPDWVPGMGGKGINIPVIPKLAKGTNNWKGGIVQISERGGEIVDLPQGSRVYPHDESVKKAYQDGANSKSKGSIMINIPKLADSIVIREDADIDKLVEKMMNKLEKVSLNVGGEDIGYSY